MGGGARPVVFCVPPNGRGSCPTNRLDERGGNTVTAAQLANRFHLPQVVFGCSIALLGSARFVRRQT